MMLAWQKRKIPW